MGGDQRDPALGGGELAVDEVEGDAQASSARPITMPTEPMIASGLRPMRSTKIIAMTVPTMLMIDVVKE
ncbi:hypothetical protein SALBM217S_08545 [Streptomyces griseoloalbus]